MGYKLAGCTVLGGVEIDPKMMKVYRTNHHPKHSYLMDVRAFNEIPDTDLPDELFNLDILDGSPPCTSFSMAGNREEDWGKAKKFREGQSEQRLDDLFDHYINTVGKLRPKVAIAENVKGLIKGTAKPYAKSLFDKFRAIGYKPSLWCFDASKMGVPQRRERTFFIASREDRPPLKFRFNERPIVFGAIVDNTQSVKPLSQLDEQLWPYVQATDKRLDAASIRYDGRERYFGRNLCAYDRVLPTVVGASTYISYENKRYLNPVEIRRASTFPADFDFCGEEVRYTCGMSVPPYMMHRVASSVIRQWFD
jgi:DNA (cytosine-5)-methyltransferase 1